MISASMQSCENLSETLNGGSGGGGDVCVGREGWARWGHGGNDGGGWEGMIILQPLAIMQQCVLFMFSCKMFFDFDCYA